ncbi:uncharacterized protein LOC134196191 isoform X2 [Corticium candelabrum]|nr:uncharacterized protein LOC134196191 isoform X2 [Corticium candelabrum]
MARIIIDGQYVAECWFSADPSTCRLVQASSTLTVFVYFSWIVFEVLVDAQIHPKASRGFLWLEAFLAGQLTGLYIGMIILATVQWIRTTANWPYITLNAQRNLCPNSVGNDCVIPTWVYASAVVTIVVSTGTAVALGWYFYWIKNVLNRNVVLSARPQEISLAVTVPGEALPNQPQSPVVIPPQHQFSPSGIGPSGHLANVHLLLDQLVRPPTHSQPIHYDRPSCQNILSSEPIGHENFQAGHYRHVQPFHRLTYEHTV